MAELYIGLMSGTSLDGVDAVLVDFAGTRPQVIAHIAAAFTDTLKAELLALNTPSDNELHRAALAGNSLVRIYAEQVEALLQRTGVDRAAVRAIGAHGQTVRHRPQEFDGTGYTLQLNQPALLAELCGIDVVADFRSRDVAAGGQGAPLVPPFHQAFFGTPLEARAVLNIGGISNLTLLDPQAAELIGFDCGPGNALMDAWCQTHTGQPYDDGGHWAAQGSVHTALLQRLQDDPFFSWSPPKSTGRDRFNAAWLQERLQEFRAIPAQDVQSSLTALTAWACTESLRKELPYCQTLIVCGGGALNQELMRRLRAAMPGCTVGPSSDWGLPPLEVEAAAFAWLARQALLRETGSLKSVTGAQGARILGGIYPA